MQKKNTKLDFTDSAEPEPITDGNHDNLDR